MISVFGRFASTPYASGPPEALLVNATDAQTTAQMGTSRDHWVACSSRERIFQHDAIGLKKLMYRMMFYIGFEHKHFAHSTKLWSLRME
jgi:hypothetical protein